MSVYLKCPLNQCENMIEYKCSYHQVPFIGCSAHFGQHIGSNQYESHASQECVLALSDEEVSIIQSAEISTEISCRVSELLKEREEKVEKLLNQIKAIEEEYSSKIKSLFKIDEELKILKKDILNIKKIPTFSFNLLACALALLKRNNMLNSDSVHSVVNMNASFYKKFKNLMKEKVKVYSLYVNSDDAKELITQLLASKNSVQSLETVKYLKSIKAHSKDVLSVAISPCSSYVVTAGADSNIKIWDLETGSQKSIIKGQTILEEMISIPSGVYHTGRVNSVKFSPCGTKLVSGGEDTVLRVWDVQSLGCIHLLIGHTSSIRSVSYSGDGNLIVSGGDDKLIILWQGGDKFKLIGHTAAVWSVVFSPCGSMVISGSNDKTVKIWNTELKEHIMTLAKHNSEVKTVDVSPCGLFICSGSKDNTVRVWNIERGQNILTLKQHKNLVRTVRFSPCGNKIVSGSYDNHIIVWDIKKDVVEACLKRHSKKVVSVDVSKHGTCIVSGGEDKVMNIWSYSLK